MMNQLTNGIRSSTQHPHKLCSDSGSVRRPAAPVDRHVQHSSLRHYVPHITSVVRSYNTDNQHPSSPTVAVHATSAPAAPTEDPLAEDTLNEIASEIMELLDAAVPYSTSDDSSSDAEVMDGEEGEMFAEQRTPYVSMDGMEDVER